MINQIRTTLCFMVLLACGAFLWPQQANAQVVYGITAVEYDASANRLYGYSATETDYYTSLYYDSYVEGYIYNESGGTLAAGADLNYPLAEVHTSAATSPGHTYYVISDHYVGAYNYYYDYYYGGYYFYDPLGYSFLGGGSYGSPYGFAPGGGPTYATYQLYYLGSTGVEANLPGVPHITDMVPGSAPLGTSVEVNFSGNYFGTNPTINVGGSGVTVGSVSYVTDTRITAIFNVDSNATTGNHSVSVSAGGYTSNSVNFHVGNRTPQITGVNPSSAAAGDSVGVTISGTGFGTNPSLSVSGGINATVTSVGDQQITANFSIPLTTVPGNYSVTVTSHGVGGSGFISGGGSSPTSNAANFTVTPAPAPRIINYAPNAAPLGTSVEINVQGENFGTNPTLQIGGSGVTVRSYSNVSNPDSQIVAILDIAADAETGNHPISVSTRGLTSNSVSFQVGDRTPEITQITPPSGVRGTTQQVVLTGKGFGSSPTLQVTGNGVNVTVNSATDTRIAATFVIASTAEPLTRTVTVTSRGATGNGFVQSPGTASNASAAYGINSSNVKITRMDERFAPGVERLNIEYSVTPITYTPAKARLEIFKNGDANNPIFTDLTTTTGTNVPYRQNGNLGWDGKANTGPDAGKYIGPEGSPYTARITLTSDDNFQTVKKGEPKKFKVELDSIETTPAATSEYNVVKPWASPVPPTELDTEVILRVKLKNKANTGVLTPVPFKVSWSFEDPDDTAGDGIDIDGKGDDNATTDEGGKRGAGSKFWKAVPNFTATINADGVTAISDVVTTDGSADAGTTKITFSTSVIGGDNYVLVAKVTGAGGQSVKDLKLKKWSVRKALNFTEAYQMTDGANLNEYVTVDKVKGAFEGDGYTDYCFTANSVLPPNAPNYCSSGTAKAAPSSPEYLGGALLPPHPLLKADGTANPDTELPTAQELADYASATPAVKAAAKTAIERKAQHWFDRNRDSLNQKVVDFIKTLGLTGSAIIGARQYHVKYDGVIGDGRPAGSPAYYPDGIVVKQRNAAGALAGADIDPNKEWNQNAAAAATDTPPRTQGLEKEGTITRNGVTFPFKIAFMFLNDTSANRKKIVGRHEVGHASDHVLFGPAGVTDPREVDHWLTGLMNRTAGDTERPPDGVDTFADDSILRLRGRKR